MLGFSTKSCSLSHCQSSTGRDGGDCLGRLEAAGVDAQGTCNRSTCSPLWQENWVSNKIRCTPECFTAGCDWSRAMCSQERASMATCPLFDAIVLASTLRARLSAPLVFVEGGSARFGCSPSRLWQARISRVEMLRACPQNHYASGFASPVCNELGRR